MSRKLRIALENIVNHFCTNCPNNRPDGCESSVEEGRFEFLCPKLKQARAALSEKKYEAEWELGAEHEYAYCSHCGHQQFANWDTYHEAEESIGEFHKEYKFCPNCGFEMKW